MRTGALYLLLVGRSQRSGPEYGTRPSREQLLPRKEASIMPDDLSKKGPADQSRINLSEPYEVQYWADKFGVSKERLSEAVRKVGHSADAVSRELKSK
jgi:hypothetical protein